MNGLPRNGMRGKYISQSDRVLKQRQASGVSVSPLDVTKTLKAATENKNAQLSFTFSWN